MDLPRWRRGEPRAQQEEEFEQLRGAFAGQLDRWPDFVRTVERLADVVPLAELEETDDGYLLEVELPGCRREDIDVQVDSGRLQISAQRRERQRVGLLRSRTRTTGRYLLDVSLPAPVDGDAVSAGLDHGVLSVTVPKTTRARRRRIQVRTQG